MLVEVTRARSGATTIPDAGDGGWRTRNRKGFHTLTISHLHEGALTELSVMPRPPSPAPGRPCRAPTRDRPTAPSAAVTAIGILTVLVVTAVAGSWHDSHRALETVGLALGATLVLRLTVFGAYCDMVYGSDTSGRLMLTCSSPTSTTSRRARHPMMRGPALARMRLSKALSLLRGPLSPPLQSRRGPGGARAHASRQASLGASRQPWLQSRARSRSR